MEWGGDDYVKTRRVRKRKGSRWEGERNRLVRPYKDAYFHDTSCKVYGAALQWEEGRTYMRYDGVGLGAGSWVSRDW